MDSAFAHYDPAATRRPAARIVQEELLAALIRPAAAAPPRNAGFADAHAAQNAAATDLEQSCQAIVARPTTGPLLGDFVQKRVPAGALVFGCLLYLTGRPAPAAFRWRYAAGADNAPAPTRRAAPGPLGRRPPYPTALATKGNAVTPTAPLLSARPHGPPVVVALTGELDVATATPLSRALTALTDTGRPDLLVDLRAVTFLDGRTITALAQARDRALARNGNPRLICVDAFILFVLRLPDTTPHFDILDGLPTLTPPRPRPAFGHRPRPPDVTAPARAGCRPRRVVSAVRRSTDHPARAARIRRCAAGRVPR
jgi:anti-anti-sigma factor